jgi:predicted short-subunit dehydrogenase-like oxidoreductase (DUF2520 family)
MDQRSGEPGEHIATLLSLSLRLRAAAADADRPDVIAKVDELMSLIAGERDPAGAVTGRTGPGAAETVQRILNGLGY